MRRLGRFRIQTTIPSRWFDASGLVMMIASRPRVCGCGRQQPRPSRYESCNSTYIAGLVHALSATSDIGENRTIHGCVCTYPLSPAVPCRPPGAVALQVAARRRSPTAAATGIMARRRSGCGSPSQGSTRPRVSALRREGPRKWGTGKMDLHLADHKSRKSVRDWGPGLTQGSGRRFRLLGPIASGSADPVRCSSGLCLER